MKVNKKGGLKITKALREQVQAEREQAKQAQSQIAPVVTNAKPDDSFSGLLKIETSRNVVIEKQVETPKPSVAPIMLDTMLSRRSGLTKLVKPTLEQAREFFN